MSITELTPKTESITCVMTMPLDTGEEFDTPVCIGYYPENGGEIFLLLEGVRKNIPAEWVEPFIKQLRRAARLAKEPTNGN